MGAIIAIDPGLGGAIALLRGDDLTVWDMPTLNLARNGKQKREVDLRAFATLLETMPAAHAFVERVGAMPGQGVSSVFSFGKCYGIILGTLAALGIPYTTVPPQTWKKALGVPKAKDGARARASELLPEHAFNWPLVKHDGRAEASLIALYGKGESHGRSRTS